MSKKLIAVITFTALCAATILGACSGGSTPAPETAAQQAAPVSAAYADYAGQTFTGTDPWGGKASVEVIMESDYLDCKYKDELTSDILFEGGVILSDNQTETDFRMEMENESFEAMYDGHFALKDGTIEITFKEGALTTKSTEGDSDSHQVAALEDSAKTIVLTK